MRGYPIECSHLDLDIYRLLLPYAASRQLYELSSGDDSDPLYRMRQQFETSEASRLLLTIAISIRNRVENSDCSQTIEFLESPVGILIKDVENPSSKSMLSFKEACHKIIHAFDVDFMVGTESTASLKPLSMEIKLFGEKKSGKKEFEWEAIINVVEFARHAYSLT